MKRSTLLPVTSMYRITHAAAALFVISGGCVSAQTALIRVAQAPVGGGDRGEATFDANVVGVIKPWATTETATAFYAYGAPNASSFNGPVPLTNERIHLFFAQASDGLCAYAVFDKPGNADGGRVQMTKWVRPRAAVVENLDGIDRESGWCWVTGHVTGNDNRWYQYQGQQWGTCCTDGWAVRVDDATWTSVRVALTDARAGCSDGALATGLNSMAALSGDGSVVPLLLNQSAVQFRPAAPCELIAWPSQQARCTGTTAMFSARPNTSGAAAFVWRKNGAVLTLVPPRITAALSPDGLQSTLRVADVTPADAGLYTCDVTSACGSTTSSALDLHISTGAPSTSNPSPLRITCVGGQDSLSVQPGGSGPFTFQWSKDGVPLHDESAHFDGTESDTLIISNAQPADAGSYACVVSNACGSVTSAPAAVSVSLCLANCDCSTTAPILNALDFQCFLNKFAAGDSNANCDSSTTAPVLNILDFTCFLNKFAAGCP